MQSKAQNFKIRIWLTYKEYMLQFDLSLSLSLYMYIYIWKKLKKCKFVHLTISLQFFQSLFFICYNESIRQSSN
jgi:hypothetical protein